MWYALQTNRETSSIIRHLNCARTPMVAVTPAHTTDLAVTRRPAAILRNANAMMAVPTTKLFQNAAGRNANPTAHGEINTQAPAAGSSRPRRGFLAGRGREVKKGRVLLQTGTDRRRVSDYRSPAAAFAPTLPRRRCDSESP
jgi:hypothetical protein